MILNIFHKHQKVSQPVKRSILSLSFFAFSCALVAGEIGNYSQPNRFDSFLFTAGYESYSRDLTIDQIDSNLNMFRDRAGISTGSEETNTEQSRIAGRWSGRATEQLVGFGEGVLLDTSGGEFEDGDWFMGLRLGVAYQPFVVNGFSAVFFGNGMYTFAMDSGLEGEQFNDVPGVAVKNQGTVNANSVKITDEKIEMWDASAGILLQYDLELGEESNVVLTPYVGVNLSIFEAIQKVDYDVNRTERYTETEGEGTVTKERNVVNSQKDRMVLQESDVVGGVFGLSAKFAECWHVRAEGRFINEESFSFSVGCDI